MEIPKRYKPNKKTHDKIFTNKLFLVNVSKDAREEQLHNLFYKYGKIKKIKTWNGFEYRCGKIIFENKVNVKLVQCDLSGLPFLNEILLVSSCKNKKQIYEEYINDVREEYSSEICVYGYRHYKRYSDNNRICRFIYYPCYCDELELTNGPREKDEKKWEFRHYCNVIKPHIKLRMKLAWPIVFRYRKIDEDSYYNSIPSQAGKWFRDRDEDSENESEISESEISE